MSIGPNLTQFPGSTIVSGAFGAGQQILAAIHGAKGSSVAAQPVFGPASLLSLGSAARGADDGLASTLAAIQFRGTPAPTLSPKQQAAEKKLIQQAFNLIDSARAHEARELIADAVRKAPGRATLIHVQGMIEMAAGEWAKAETYFRKAAAIDPSLGSLDEADNARALQQDDAVVLTRAQRLLARRDTRAAGHRLLDALTTRSPRNTEALLVKADALARDGSSIKSLVTYARAVATADEEQLLRLEARFAELVRRTPNDAFAHNLLGKVYLRLGRNDAALASLEQASRLAVDPSAYRGDEALAHVAIGRERLQRGNLAEALASLERAAALAPGDASVRLARAEAFAARAESRARHGDEAAAIADYERAARDARSAGDAAAALRERIARSAYSLGRRLEARRMAAGDEVGQEVVAFQTAYDLDPENTTYRRKLAETRRVMGDELMARGNYADAAGAYRRAYELERGNVAYRDLAIGAYRADGDQKLAQLRYDEAIAAYRLAFRLDGQSGVSRSKLADAYNRAGLNARDNDRNRARAAEYFREALHLFPDNQEYRDNYNSVVP